MNMRIKNIISAIISMLICVGILYVSGFEFIRSSETVMRLCGLVMSGVVVHFIVMMIFFSNDMNKLHRKYRRYV